YVAFGSTDTTLDPDHPNTSGIYVRDMTNNETELVIPNGSYPFISNNGRFLTAGSDTALRIYDRKDGTDWIALKDCDDVTSTIGIGTELEITIPRLGGDGQHAYFMSQEGFAGGDDNGRLDFYLHEFCTCN
ncbi:MAG: hypothetical protein OET90_05755, partial [Desulfuromonadales bacterium]|nr:hypothetical protein [Desulfuromonadales bacterium]